jgi:PIN domain nuclease of toxin-antitoxin system
VRLLLDTHALLWAVSDPDALTERARDAIRDGRNEVLVSAASVWEIAIKRAMGKLTAPDDLGQVLTAASFGPLPISLEHASLAGSLPPHHRDPFDRLLIAQARLESLTIVTRDARFASYGVQLLIA